MRRRFDFTIIGECMGTDTNGTLASGRNAVRIAHVLSKRTYGVICLRVEGYVSNGSWSVFQNIVNWVSKLPTPTGKVL